MLIDALLLGRRHILQMHPIVLCEDEDHWVNQDSAGREL